MNFRYLLSRLEPSCNLGCHYCYYLEKKNLYRGNKSHLMSDDTLEKYIIQHIDASTDNLISFSWHGGEPLLAGIDFYRKVSKFNKNTNLQDRKSLMDYRQTDTLLR